MKNFILPIKGIKQLRLCCGPCCVEMVLKFYGYNNIDQKTIGQDIMIKIKRGCYPSDVIKYLKRYNIIAEKREGIRTLNIFSNKSPIIIGEREHFLLLVGKEDDKYIIIDPYFGRKIKKDKSYFKTDIKDYIIIIKGIGKNEKKTK